MRIQLSIIIALFTPFIALETAAQSECAEYHRFNCERAPDSRFNVNGQSKSASVQIGIPTELNIIVYKGQDYRIKFCYDDRVIGDHVVARLIEKVREPRDITEQVQVKEEIVDEKGDPTGKFRDVTRTVTTRVYEDVKKVLWTNQEHEMADEVEFTATATKRLMVEVTAPGVVDAKPKHSDKQFDIGCVGILIEHMATPEMGFDGKKQ